MGFLVKAKLVCDSCGTVSDEESFVDVTNPESAADSSKEYFYENGKLRCFSCTVNYRKCNSIMYECDVDAMLDEKGR